VAVAHLDGAGTDEGIMNMVHRVQELALGYPEGRLELQLVGGYSDSRNYSEELFYNIMRKLFFLCNSYVCVFLTYVCDAMKF
jgi:protein N-terminal asparagine amidohydrolase